MICAGKGLRGTPGTLSPAAHATASMMSESSPPHLPSARTGRILAPQSIPASHWPLLEFAAMLPATPVPCHELSPISHSRNSGSVLSAALTQSPGSEASASRLSPSLAILGSVMKS